MIAVRAEEHWAPPKDYDAQQLIVLREKYVHWGSTGPEYFDRLQKKCRNGRREAARILSLLHGSV